MNEKSISAVIRFDEEVTNAIDFHAEFVTSPETASENEFQHADTDNSNVLLSRTNKRRALTQRMLQKLNLMFPIAALNISIFYLRRFRDGYAYASETGFSEETTECVGSIIKRINRS